MRLTLYLEIYLAMVFALPLWKVVKTAISASDNTRTNADKKSVHRR